jgi:hypothetical protein
VALADRLQPLILELSKAARNFRDTFDATPRNPKLQIIPDVGGGVNMGVQGDGRVSGRAPNANDPYQLWRLELDAASAAYRILLDFNGQTRALVSRNPIPSLPPFVILPQIEHPSLEPPGADGNQLWLLDVGASRQLIRHRNDTEYVLDIAGNSGWGPGTDILCYRRNDGNNQHWSFQPKPRRPQEIRFYDLIAPAAAVDPPAVVNDVQRIYGAWVSIGKDLEIGLDSIGKKFDLAKPFISGLNADAAIASWKQVANDADDFIRFARDAMQRAA